MRRHGMRCRLAFVLAFILATPFVRAAPQSAQSTALNTRLEDPSGLAVNAAGDLYISDTRQHRVLKVSASGVVTVVAGTGKGGYSGDGG